MSIKYDPTVTLGHLLTFAGFIVTGFVAYSTLEKRVSLLEERTEATVRLALERSIEQKETLREIRTDLKELTRDVSQVLKQREGQK